MRITVGHPQAEAKTVYNVRGVSSSREPKPSQVGERKVGRSCAAGKKTMGSRVRGNARGDEIWTE